VTIVPGEPENRGEQTDCDFAKVMRGFHDIRNLLVKTLQLFFTRRARWARKFVTELRGAHQENLLQLNRKPVSESAH